MQGIEYLLAREKLRHGPPQTHAAVLLRPFEIALVLLRFDHFAASCGSQHSVTGCGSNRHVGQRQSFGCGASGLANRPPAITCWLLLEKIRTVIGKSFPRPISVRIP